MKLLYRRARRIARVKVAKSLYLLIQRKSDRKKTDVSTRRLKCQLGRGRPAEPEREPIINPQMLNMDKNRSKQSKTAIRLLNYVFTRGFGMLFAYFCGQNKTLRG